MANVDKWALLPTISAYVRIHFCKDPVPAKMWPVFPPFPAETAVNIAYACNIFEEEMDGIFIVEGKNDETVRQELRYRWENCHSS